MHMIHNYGINIFGVIPLCQFYERARAGDMCSAEHPILVYFLECLFLEQILCPLRVKQTLRIDVAHTKGIRNIKFLCMDR